MKNKLSILYALTRGFLDDIPVKDILRFEAEFLSWLDTNHTDVLDHIRTTKELPSDEDMSSCNQCIQKDFRNI